MKKISVVIPCFNKFQYIYDALESVLCQDYLKVELIVADDGSEDFPKDKIELFIQDKLRDKEYVILHSACNCGTVRNLNKALGYVSGDYVLILAADDVLNDNHVISRYVQCCMQKPEVEVFVAQVFMYDQELKRMRSPFIDKSDICLLQEGKQKELYTRMAWTCFLPAPGVLYKREIFDYETFNEEYFLVEDWSYYFSLIRRGTRFQYLDFVSAKHRDGGISHSNQCKSAVQQRYYEDIYNIQGNEILAHQELLQDKDRKRLVQHVKRDRIKYIAKYQVRKYCLKKKIIWVINNPIIILLLIEYYFKSVLQYFEEYRND